jgi:phosphatidylinositol glycan class B
VLRVRPGTGPRSSNRVRSAESLATHVSGEGNRPSFAWLRRAPEWMVFGSLLLAFLLKASIALSDQGIYWPDEIFQSLEPAHRAVFGYGLVAWEFLEGARNWALPGIIAALIALVKAIGLDAPGYYIGVTRLFFVAISLGTGWGVWRLARVLGASRWPAALAASSYALCRVSLYFSHRAMSENACALPLVLGLWLLIENASRRRRVTGMALLGLAVLIRLQCGIFCVLALSWQLLRRRWRHAGESLLVLTACAAMFGFIDHLSWSNAPGARFGGWFHSAFKYIDFNLLHSGGAAWGIQSRDYYLHTLDTALPLLWPLIALGALCASRQAFFVFSCALAFLVGHSLIPHKEIRFILPILPLFFALAPAGFALLPSRPVRSACSIVLAFAGFISLAGFRATTFGDLGANLDKAGASAWDDYGPINRLLEVAGSEPDLCGLRVDVHLAWSGGYSYLHKKVPLYMAGQPAAYYNYAITPGGGGTRVAEDGGWELIRTAAQCTPDPGYSYHLP